MRNKQALDDILFLLEMIDDMGTLDEAEAFYDARAEYDRDHGRYEMQRENQAKSARVRAIRERLADLRTWVIKKRSVWTEGPM